MKTKLILLFFVVTSALSFSQQNEGIKMQKADESGFIEVDKAPELKSQLKPEYPKLAKLAGIQGTVYLKLLIDEKGNVAKAKVEKGVKDMLDDAALASAKKAMFSPALIKDKPVKVWVILPIAFKLDAGNSKKSNDLEPNGLVEIEVMPKVLELAKPDYPELAKKARIQGKVLVKVLIDKEGIPKEVVVVKSDNEIFNKPTTDAVMKSKFSPAVNKGEKITAWVILPYNYKLEMIEINSSWFPTSEKAAIEYTSLIKSIEQTGEYENIKHEKEKTKRLESEVQYGDESALFTIEGKNYSKFLFITRNGRGIVRTTQESIDDLKQYIVKNMDGIFMDLQKKK